MTQDTNTAAEVVVAALKNLKSEDLEKILAATKAEEAEAQLAEGLAPMPEDLIALRQEKLELDEKLDELAARKREIQDTFGERLQDAGLVGFMLHGKVHARRKNGTRTDVDRKRLKDELPEVYANYLKTTEYVSITIN